MYQYCLRQLFVCFDIPPNNEVNSKITFSDCVIWRNSMAATSTKWTPTSAACSRRTAQVPGNFFQKSSPTSLCGCVMETGGEIFTCFVKRGLPRFYKIWNLHPALATLLVSFKLNLDFLLAISFLSSKIQILVRKSPQWNFHWRRDQENSHDYTSRHHQGNHQHWQ